jgi:glycosyltransferase involved in cell wall biosynthesis
MICFMNDSLKSDKAKEQSDSERIRILFLTPNANVQGPMPKLAPIFIRELEDLNCQITRSTWGPHSNKENLLQKVFGRFVDICKMLKNLIINKPDILYVDTTLDEHALIRDFPLLVVTSWFPVKKVLKIHGSKTALLIEPHHGIYKFIARFLIHQSQAILLLSNDGMQKWKYFEPKGSYYRVDNPFIVENRLKSNGNLNAASQQNLSPTLLFVGRLIEEKGIFELLEAMTDILKQVDCRLIIAGDGNEKEEVIRRIKNTKLENSVSLLGYLDAEKLYQVYQQSTIFILPSYREGFPTAIFEAMNFGLPIVATAVGGIPDHLQDGVNALFIKPKDAQSLANAVVRLLNDPKLCLEMHHANLDKVQEFRPENVASNYIAIFSKILGE